MASSSSSSKLEPYELKQQHDGPQREAWSRLVSGRYAVLSWKGLEALLRENNETQFTLTSRLVANCSFVANEAFKDPQTFKAQIRAPRGIEQIVRPDEDRALFFEEIQLASFLKEEQLIGDDTRLFFSNDLADDLSSCRITPELLDKCIFVSKQIFNPAIQKKYLLELHDGKESTCRTSKLSTAIKNMVTFRDKNRQLNNDPDPSNHVVLMYSISAIPL